MVLVPLNLLLRLDAVTWPIESAKVAMIAKKYNCFCINIIVQWCWLFGGSEVNAELHHFFVPLRLRGKRREVA